MYLDNTPHLSIDYEELDESLDKVSNFIGVSLTKPRLVKLEHPKKQEFKEKLLQRLSEANIEDYFDPELPI